MGFWGKFAKRVEDSFEHRVSISFARIKRDTINLFRWITWLRTRLEQLEAKHTALTQNNEHTHSKFYQNLEAIKQENQKLREHLKQLYDYIKVLHEEVKELHNDVHKSSTIDTQLDAQRYTPSTAETTTQVEEKLGGMFEPRVTVGIQGDKLTKAERLLLATLYHATSPLTYAEISKILGLSYGTIKNRLNRIKSKGFDVEFIVDSKGQRRFYLPETEKIKLSGR
ncbi:hypothetical protein DRJ48_00800 [Candidatus Woesearchaeota archaeon]|nr:HTH domain-containing protein [Candidatus Woesearchaeota archaeon]RLE43480.1 MAG: hypothetical protein DRJ48_00800 [Candidatus Woesearchaeota archaeon]